MARWRLLTTGFPSLAPACRRVSRLCPPTRDLGRTVTAHLTLICHAPTAATREVRFPLDEALDTAGAAALACAAPKLCAAIAKAGLHLTAPERRARGTAEALGIGFGVDEGLRDQEIARWAGRGLVDIAEAEPDGLTRWRAEPAAAPHGGESLLDLLARVAAWMEVRAGAGGRVAAVTHPAWMRAAVVTALGAGARSFWRIEAPPLAVATVSHDGRRWTLAGLVAPS